MKVLHPDVQERFKRDLKVLKSLVASIAWLFPQLEWLSLEESLDEFGALMNVQVDMVNEVKSMVRFTENFRDDEHIIFPKPILELCSHNVLVESFETGVHVGAMLQDLESVPIEQRKTIADRSVETLVKMVFKHNFVHCDLHPGNILVRDSGDTLVILDPGLTATLTPQDHRNFKTVFKAVCVGDGRLVGKEFLQQSKQECQNPELFIDEMEKIVHQTRSQGFSLTKLDVGELLSNVFSLLRSHRVKLDPNFVSVILSIMVLEGLGRTLDPDLDLMWKATPYLLIS